MTAAEKTTLVTRMAIRLTNLVDTENALVADRLWRTNPAGTEVIQVPEPVQHPAIPPVGHLPTTNIGEIVYLTRDLHQGVREDLVVTAGFLNDGSTMFAGYDRGNRDHQTYGLADKDSGLLEAITGEGVAGSYTLTRVWSFSRHWIDSLANVIIAGAEHVLGNSVAYGGAYYRHNRNPPTLTGPTFTVQFVANAAFYYRQQTTLLTLAGLYHWDDDATPPKYAAGGPTAATFDGHGAPTFSPTCRGR